MELMVVITIIFLLMSLVLVASKNVDNTARRSRTTTEIAALGTALENYKIDNGTYPVPTSGSMPNASTDGDPTAYTTSAKLLFTSLSGRSSFEIDPVAGGPKSYYPFKKNQVTGTPSAAVDAWGNSYGYNSVNPVYNVGFCDLWSTANAADISKKTQWIGNFKTD
jgi:type II secretory pathway pseudopilin PulG